MVYGIQKFHHYVAGGPFTVMTDHQALLYLEYAKAHNARLVRWALKLANYDYKV